MKMFRMGDVAVWFYMKLFLIFVEMEMEWVDCLWLCESVNDARRWMWKNVTPIKLQQLTYQVAVKVMKKLACERKEGEVVWLRLCYVIG